MSFKDRLKGMILEDDNTESGGQQTTNKTGSASAVRPSAPPAYQVSSTASADPAFLDLIKKVAESAPQKSYTEFQGFLEALASTPLDENSRYVAALSTAGHKGFRRKKFSGDWM